MHTYHQEGVCFYFGKGKNREKLLLFVSLEKERWNNKLVKSKRNEAELKSVLIYDFGEITLK